MKLNSTSSAKSSAPAPTRFGFEWARYARMEPKYEDQFRNWIHPLGPDDFRAKSVLDAGCGMGRNSFWAARWGAAKVVAFDADERAVREARANLAQFPNVTVYTKSIYDIPWQNAFDLVMSIGVVHHLEKSTQAIQNLVQALKPGGVLVLWVYSYEGNEWIVRWINPIRRNITSKLPLGLLHALSYAGSFPLWVFLKLYRGKNRYLRQLATFRFWHLHSIVFDQLLPEIAHYWTQSQVRDLCRHPDLEAIQVHRPPNAQGWTMVGSKKLHAS